MQRLNFPKVPCLGYDGISLLDILHAAPRIWGLLGRSDIACLRLCSRQARDLHDSACTALDLTIKEQKQLQHGVIALRNIIARGCKPVSLIVTTRLALPTALTHDILSICANATTNLSLQGPHSGLQQLLSVAPALQRLSLDLYDIATSAATDSALMALSHRLTALGIHLHGGAVMPYEGVAACGMLTELRIGLYMERAMHIGPFRYGRQQGGGAAASAGPSSQRRPRRGGGGLYGGKADGAVIRPGVVTHIAVPVHVLLADSSGHGNSSGRDRGLAGAGGGGTEDGSRGGTGAFQRPVPPAIAAIASLAPTLRCLELYGSSVDRILDPPYRLLGLSSLRNLNRLRIDLPVDEEGIGVGSVVAVQHPYAHAAVAAAAVAYGMDAVRHDRADGDAALSNEANHINHTNWRLGPLLSALTWVQDLDLGPSYGLPAEALPALASLSRLERLRCGTLLTPLPSIHGSVDWLMTAPSGPAAALTLVASAAESSHGSMVRRLPLPPSVRHLQFTHLPAVPVLAALAAQPALISLSLNRQRHTEPLTAPSVGPMGQWAAAAHNATATAMLDDNAALRNVTAAGNDATAAAVHDAVATAATSTVLQQGDQQQPARMRGDLNTRMYGKRVVVEEGGAAALSNAPPPAAPHAPPPAPQEPLRIALVGEDFSHEHRGCTAGRADQVAAAAALLARLLPAANRSRLALSPFGRSPATLEGPHGGWMGQLGALGAGVEGVELAAFNLEPGDLLALREALPGMKSLNLFCCRLDADDVRHLMAVQPPLGLRIDSSCKYVGYAGAYDNDGENGTGVSGEFSEEFVDEAELAPGGDGEVEAALGVWPVAVELQRAYERALDVSDEEDVDEGEGDEVTEEQDEGEQGRGSGGVAGSEQVEDPEEADEEGRMDSM